MLHKTILNYLFIYFFVTSDRQKTDLSLPKPFINYANIFGYAKRPLTLHLLFQIVVIQASVIGFLTKPSDTPLDFLFQLW